MQQNGYLKQEIIHYLLLGVLCSLVLFIKLGSFHMRMWDESMFAVNTYEMMDNGNFFSLSYNGIPDLYNTKPPLTSWAQLFFVKIIGYNELAIRLPSAIASFFTLIFSFKFIARYFDYKWAWIVVLIILTSAGFVGFHTSRTGESDAILTLFLTLTNFAFIRFIIEENKKEILALFLWITLAFATKLYAAFLFIPAYLIVLLYFKKLKSFMLTWHFAIGLLGFLGLTLTMLLLRELESPGYLEIIWSNDAGRLFHIPKEFEKSTFYYIENFFVKRFSIYFILFVFGCLLLFFRKREVHQQSVLIICLFLSLSYLLIITLSVTKLPWYDMPLYPFLAPLCAYPIVEMIRVLLMDSKKNGRTMSYMIIALIFFYPYYYRFSKSQGNKIDDGDIKLEANERYLHQAIKNDCNLDGLKVLYRSYDGPLLFYKYKLRENNQEIELHTNTLDLEVGDHVLVCKDEHRDSLQKRFNLVWLDGYQYADVYLLE